MAFDAKGGIDGEIEEHREQENAKRRSLLRSKIDVLLRGKLDGRDAQELATLLDQLAGQRLGALAKDQATAPAKISPRTAAAILQRVGGKLAEDDRAELERLLAAATDEKLATGLARASQAMREPISHERRIAQDEAFAARYPGAARIEVDNTGQQPPRRRASAGRASSFVEEIERRVKVMR
jgi:hypothetical protein